LDYKLEAERSWLSSLARNEFGVVNFNLMAGKSWL
jgi:hypothetical protein